MLKRNVKVTFRMDKAEYQTLQKCVKKTGYSQEGYIRSLIAGNIPREMPPLDYQAILGELRAIGSNMNQIAVRANATGFFLADEYAGNVKRLVATISTIRDAVILPERIK